MKEVVIVSGARTPVGDLLGSLKDFNCVELGVIVLKAAMEKAKVGSQPLSKRWCSVVLDAAGVKDSIREGVAIHAGCSGDWMW